MIISTFIIEGQQGRLELTFDEVKELQKELNILLSEDVGDYDNKKTKTLEFPEVPEFPSPLSSLSSSTAFPSYFYNLWTHK